MDLEKFPEVPTDLIEALEKQYPDKHPAGNFDHNEALVFAGTIRLIRFLRYVHDEKSKTVLGDSNVQS